MPAPGDLEALLPVIARLQAMGATQMRLGAVSLVFDHRLRAPDGFGAAAPPVPDLIDEHDPDAAPAKKKLTYEDVMYRSS